MDEYSTDRRAQQTGDLNVPAQLLSPAQGWLDSANDEFDPAQPNVWNKTFYQRIIQAKSG